MGSISDDEEEPTELDGAAGIYVVGNYAYVAAHQDNGVEILDVSDPSNPFHVGKVSDDEKEPTLLAGAWNIHVSGRYAYVTAAIDDGVEILDISGLDAPSASIGAVAADTLDVSNHAQVGNTLSVGGGGIKSDGALAAEGPASFGGQIDIGGPAAFNGFLNLTPRTSPQTLFSSSK